MATDRSGNCWHCGNALNALEYGRQDSCSRCGRDSRVCRNCDWHDPAADNQCRESQADRVVDKEKSNFCDYFRPKEQSGSSANSREAMRAAAEALFRKKS